MYKVTLETPRGTLEFNIQALQELEKIILENSDYTELSAKQEKPKVKEMTKTNNGRSRFLFS